MDNQSSPPGYVRRSCAQIPLHDGRPLATSDFDVLEWKCARETILQTYVRLSVRHSNSTTRATARANGLPSPTPHGKLIVRRPPAPGAARNRHNPKRRDEQCREPERRNRADLKWTINRRRPVTSDVHRPRYRCMMADHWPPRILMCSNNSALAKRSCKPVCD